MSVQIPATTVRRSAAAAERRGAGVAALGVLVALLACKQSGDPAGSAPSASAAATPSALAAVPSAPAPPVLPRLEGRDIEAGEVTTGGAWLPRFRAGRAENDLGLAWSAARGICQQRDQDLCSEPQWRRACRLDPAIGKVPSWTLTARDASGFVVRGGTDCDSATVVRGAQAEPGRIGLCCSRAIALESANHHPGFLRAVSEKLTSLERAVNARSGPAVGQLLDDPITFYSLQRARKSVALARFEAAFHQHPDERTVHGSCLVTLELVGHVFGDQWIAECDKVVEHGGEVAVVSARYVFGGPQVKLRSLTETRVVRGWAAP
jgi:hypothetical protein